MNLQIQKVYLPNLKLKIKVKILLKQPIGLKIKKINLYNNNLKNNNIQTNNDMKI